MDNIQSIKETQHILINRTSLAFKRFLYSQIDFKQRLIGIVGPRGAGKTTLILQYLKEQQSPDKAVYFLADSVLFKKGDLLNLARVLHLKYGIQLICIDEIHRYENWNQELKNIYDTLPGLKIIFSGSSSLNLTKGEYDLSRRGVIYNLPGFSFREYLLFDKNINNECFQLSNLMQNYQAIANKVTDDNILRYFNEYLTGGYYAFFKETNNKYLYWQQVNNIIDKIVYGDISSFYNLKTQNLVTFKQILSFLATISPGKVNINKLANSLKRNNNTIAEYLQILKDTGLVRFLTNNKTGHALVRRARKIFLDNTNLVLAMNNNLGQSPDIGMLRELFVLNQLQNAGYVPGYSLVGDLEIDGFVLEIGGKNKNRRQIKDIENSYLVLDDILVADDRKIPLYLFGFLY